MTMIKVECQFQQFADEKMYRRERMLHSDGYTSLQNEK